jgi:diguanylate cyclase (GGDEF)-like protein
MHNKKWTYGAVVITLGVFLSLYFAVPSGPMRQALVYSLVIIGLFFSSLLPEIVVIVNGLGLVLLFTTTPLWPVPTLGLAVLLAGTALLPLYYNGLARKERDLFRDRHFSMQEEADKLQVQLADSTLKRQNLENEIDRINQLYVLGRELVEHMDLDEVVENMQRVLSSNPGIKAVCIFSWDKDGWRPLHIPRTQDPAQWSLFVQEQKLLHDARTFQVLDSPAWLGRDAVIFLPVFLEKDMLAAIFLVTEEGYAQHYLERASIFIPQIALGLKRTRLFLEVQERSRNDGLTGLYLRRYFLERLQTEIQRARRYSTVFSLLLADLDFFKSVNDTHGHLAGDKVLREVARIFSGAVRPGDMVGRYGGEEFIVLLPFADDSEVQRMADKIRKAVAASSIDVEEQKLSLTMSIGICHYPRDGASAKELLAAADAALYWVKNNGRNGIKEFGETRKDTKQAKDKSSGQSGTFPPQM